MQVLPSPSSDAELAVRVDASRVELDAWVREVVAWHFDPASGSPFWLEYAAKLDWDPRRDYALTLRPDELSDVERNVLAGASSAADIDLPM